MEIGSKQGRRRQHLNRDRALGLKPAMPISCSNQQGSPLPLPTLASSFMGGPRRLRGFGRSSQGRPSSSRAVRQYSCCACDLATYLLRSRRGAMAARLRRQCSGNGWAAAAVAAAAAGRKCAHRLIGGIKSDQRSLLDY